MFKRVLDLITSAAVLAVCLLILAQAVRSFTSPPPPPPAPDGPPAATRPKAGDRLEPIAGVDLSQSPRTLVMALQSSCRFCSESMGFYRELAKRKAASIRLIVVAPDDPATARQYVAANGFAPDQIAWSDLPAIHVGGTPTLLLADRAGVIERVWVGKLTAAGEKEVLAEVTR